MTRLALALVLSLCTLALPPPSAAAHASLVSTDPTEGAVLTGPPRSVTLTFDEPVRLSADGTHLYDASGSELATDTRSVDIAIITTTRATMAKGTYVLTYRVVSADSHPIAGSLSFSVGAPSETVAAPADADRTTDRGVVAVLGVVQGITYAALLLTTGLAIFALWLLPGVTGFDRVRGRLRLVIRTAAAAAAVGVLVLVPVGVTYQQGLDLRGLGSGLAWTGWVSSDGLLAALVLAGLACAVVVSDRPPSTLARVLVLPPAAVVLAALALVGHTRSYGPAALVVTADVLHVAAAATWFGGLVGLAISLPALARRERVAAETLSRFSLVAGALLAGVAVAGVILGWRIVGSWSGLVDTTYGLVLLAKVALVAAVAAIAGWNRYRLLPSVERAVGFAGRLDAAHRLKTAVRAEAGLMLLVLALTGFLVNQVPREPEGPAPGRRDTLVAVADEVRVVAHVGPGRVGPNTVSVQVQDLRGEPLEPYAAPRISLSSGDVDLGTRPADNVDSGTYETQVVIPSAGTWRVEVSVRTGEFENPVLTLETTVADDSG